jgi:O-acetylhomoserine (thiol)-lyase
MSAGTTRLPGPPQPVQSFETLQIHAGQEADPATGARAVPIYQTTSFVFQDSAHAAGLFDLSINGFAYTRVINPTSAVAEARLAALDGGTAAVLTGSGQAAITLALLALARAGDHVVAASSLYGGTVNLLQHTFGDLGIEVTFVDDPDDETEWREAVRPSTRAFFAETLGNPRGNVLDVPMVARVAHEEGVPLVVDNTLLTPYLQRPLELGADVVVYSATKFLAGHGTVIAGAIVDGGRFDFGAAPDRWFRLVGPDPSYHGSSFWELFSPQGFAYAAWIRSRLLRDLGPALAPINAFLLLQGLETLSLRMERHVANTLRVAAWLEAQPEVASVAYPGLASSPWHDRSQALLPRGAGAVLAFELRGGHQVATRLVESLSLFSHLANVGDVRSLAIHPASTTHAQLDPAQLLASGVTPGLVRLSVGLEHADDLIADLAGALRLAAGSVQFAVREDGR